MLRRALGTGGVLALTIAALSPTASVFVTGAAVIRLAGTGAGFAMLAGGAIVLVATALCAELGAAFPHAGGIYHGIASVLGRRAGAAVLALNLLTAPALIAFVALGLAGYVRAIGVALPAELAAIGAIALAATIGILRLRAGMWMTGALLAAELVALAVVIALSWSHRARGLGTTLLHPMAADGHGGLMPTGTLALMLATIGAAYACSGSNLALNFAEEITGDARHIGSVVMIGGMIAVALVALPVVGVVLAAPNLPATLSAEAPIATTMRALAGDGAARVIALVVAIAIFSHIAGAMLAYSRLVFAAARSLGGADGALAALVRLGRRSGAPAAAAAALGGVAMALTLVGERALLLLISGEVITPSLMFVAVLVGRRRGQTGTRSFRAPLYPMLPIIGVAIAMAFLAADLLDPLARYGIALLVLCAAAAALASGRGSHRTTA